MSTTQEPIDREALRKYLKGSLANTLIFLIECRLEDVIAARSQIAAFKRLCVDHDITVRLELSTEQFYNHIKKELHREFRCGLCYNTKSIPLPKEMKVMGIPEELMIPGSLVAPCPECSQ